MRFLRYITTDAIGLAAAWTLNGATSLAADRTLYQRLGGQGAIQAVVTKFINNVRVDQRINGYFANADLKKVQ